MSPLVSPILALIQWLQAHVIVKWIVILCLVPVVLCLVIYLPVGIYKRAKLGRARDKLRPFAMDLLEAAVDQSGCGSPQAFARQFTLLDVGSSALGWEVRGEGGPRRGSVDYFTDMRVTLDVDDQLGAKLKSLAGYLSDLLPVPTRVESKGADRYSFGYDPVAVTTLSDDGKRAVTTAGYAHVGGGELPNGFLILPADAPAGAGRGQEDTVLRI